MALAKQKLGRRQMNCLEYLIAIKGQAGWDKYPNMPSGTARLVESLVRRGLVTCRKGICRITSAGTRAFRKQKAQG